MDLIEPKGRRWTMTPLVDELIAELKAAEIEVLFLDPMSRLHSGDEDGATMSALTKALEYIAQNAGVSVVFVHHAGKDASALGGKYAGRGSSVITDNTSETLAFTEYRPDQRKNLKVDTGALRPEEAQDDIIKMSHTRCSDGPTGPVMYFVRSRQTGLMRMVELDPITKRDTVRELLIENKTFEKWAARVGSFAKNTLRTNREDIFEETITEKECDELFDEALAQGVFRKTGKRPHGGTLVEYRPPQNDADIQVGKIGADLHKPSKPKKKLAKPKKRGARNVL